MKTPSAGHNKTQSFFDYETTFGKVRIGLEGLRVFFEGAGKKLFMYGRSINQTYEGTIDLSNDLTHYDPVSITSNAEVALAANPVIGGSAEIRMIGDGVHTPLFGAFVASTGTDPYSPVLNAVNKVVFYYDGVSAFYSITNL